MSITNRESAGGRPPKFKEVRRPITVTLPERVLKALAMINKDRALALVKCVEAVAGTGKESNKPVELVEVLPGQALIVVGPCPSLSRIAWLRLVEISPTRYLLVLPPGKPVDSLELELMDLIESTALHDKQERAILCDLRLLVNTQRRLNKISQGELVFVDVERDH